MLPNTDRGCWCSGVKTPANPDDMWQSELRLPSSRWQRSMDPLNSLSSKSVVGHGCKMLSVVLKWFCSSWRDHAPFSALHVSALSCLSNRSNIALNRLQCARRRSILSSTSFSRLNIRSLSLLRSEAQYGASSVDDMYLLAQTWRIVCTLNLLITTTMAGFAAIASSLSPLTTLASLWIT